jgi:hypothetical protein
VPSLEWCAQQILSDNPSPGLLPLLYAGQVNEWDLHLAGFTMRKLRRDFEAVGLKVNRARSGPLTMLAGGMEVVVEQHYVSGVKPDKQRRKPKKE